MNDCTCPKPGVIDPWCPVHETFEWVNPTESNDVCPCTALFTNLDCKKHARPYLLSFHRALPGTLTRLDILAAAFRHEDFFGHWPSWLYIRPDQWEDFLSDQTDRREFTLDNQTLTPSFLGMQVEFIPTGQLRVGDRRYV